MNVFIYVFLIIFIKNVTSQTEIQISANCSTPNQEAGICILFKNCDELKTLIQQVPLTNETRGFLRRSNCGYENGSVLVCCKIPQLVSKVDQIQNQSTTVQDSSNCLTPKNEEGTCILFEKCNELVTLIQQKPLTDENRSFLNSSRCGYQNNKILVCCKKPKPITTENTVRKFGFCFTPINEDGECVYQENCIQTLRILRKKTLNEVDKFFLQESKCGMFKGRITVCCPPKYIAEFNQPEITLTVQIEKILPKQDECASILSNRIFGGNKTAIDEFPWMALLEYNKPGDRKGFHCGGSLISSRYVITASHCVSKEILPANWNLTGVRLGEWDLRTEKDCQRDSAGFLDCADPHVDVDIERIIRHDNYNPGSKNQNNDIALLRLVRHVQFTDFIRPICLPLNTQLRNSDFNGFKLDIAGWGKTPTQQQSNVKLKATVSVVNLKKCQEVYSIYNRNLIDSQICAGGSLGVDSCTGDSGGPLLGTFETTNNVYYMLVGIVSYGPEVCGLEGWPGVYTRVGAYIDWIESNLQE